MKKLLLAAVLLTFSSCGVFPISRTVPLDVVAVDIPATLAPGADLRVTVKYVIDCTKQDERLLLTHRTLTTLALDAVGTDEGQNLACPAVYVEETLTYVDSGTVARTSPFEVIVNGQSWGKIETK